MATKNETINNANESKVSNESNATANVDTTTTTDNTTNESNATANESNATANESKVSNESNATANATDESKPQATAPTAEEIAAAKVETKHQKEISERYKMEAPKEVEATKFAGAYVLGVYRPTTDRKNSDKTFYKIFYNGKIFDGYSATEFCDAVGIERKHRAGNTPKVITLLDKLQALKNAIEAIDSKESDFVNFAKIVAQKIESEKLESERTGFLAKYEMVVGLFDMITEATFAKKYNSDDLALALKLGYKFADTKATDTKDTTDTTDNK